METWLLLALASGVLFGVYNIFIKMYSAKAPAYVSVMIIGLGIFLCGLAYLLFQKDPAGQVKSAMPVLALILISAAIWFVATLLQVIAYADPKASLAIGAIVITVALGVTATVSGAIVFSEKFTALQMLGMAFAIVGTVLLSS